MAVAPLKRSKSSRSPAQSSLAQPWPHAHAHAPAPISLPVLSLPSQPVAVPAVLDLEAPIPSCRFRFAATERPEMRPEQGTVHKVWGEAHFFNQSSFL